MWAEVFFSPQRNVVAVLKTTTNNNTVVKYTETSRFNIGTHISSSQHFRFHDTWPLYIVTSIKMGANLKLNGNTLWIFK